MMDNLRRATILTALADQLERQGSWCGETHLQKATYFLQELFNMPLDFSFVLYKHGPYSFELHDELIELRASRLLELRPMPLPYGPMLLATDMSQKLRERFPRTMEEFRKSIEAVGKVVDKKRVSDLEGLATALYVERTEGISDRKRVASRIRELKPHITQERASHAVSELAGLV